ncbi:hypothetical protein ABPG74_010806 [Tetrahymena malaccensis]
MNNKSVQLQKSPQLRGQTLASSLVASDHMKSLLAKNANQIFKPWNNKFTPNAPQSPFGDFPKDYMKGVEKTRVSPLVRNSQNILNSLTQDTSNIGSRMSPYKVNKSSPPKAGALERRLIPQSEFRRYYDRADLPIKVNHSGGGSKLIWKIDPAQLDYHHYLPIFIDGMREKVDPYRTLSILGTFDLIEKGENKILPVIPQLIMPLKTNLNTRDPEIISITLRVIQKLVLSGNMVGEALVPYYRQLLPVFNLYKNYNKSSGDFMDFGQRNNMSLGDIIQETLELLERAGGDDAFINIKYMIPTYESCIFT